MTAPSFPGFAAPPPGPPVFDERRGAWLALSYPDVHRVLHDYEAFSSARDQLAPGDTAARDQQAVMLTMDPPRHRRYRDLVAQAFTPRMVARLEPRVYTLADALLDRVAGAGRMDLIGDFAYLLSVGVIADMLGVPRDHHEQFRAWSDAFFEMTTPAAAQANLALSQYFAEEVARRRRAPQDDLVSALVQAQDRDERLTDLEISAHCSMILLAGNETTRNLIGNAFLCFDAFPEAPGRLRAEPALIPAAVEEVLRYLPPARTAPRVARVDVELGGQAIRAGQWVLPIIASANRDPQQFSDPQRFDVARAPNRHLSFGYGVHFCLGAALARLEARIALERILARLPDIRVLHDAPIPPVESPVVYGVRALPVSFSA